MATARGAHAFRARPPGTRRGSSRARCQSAGRQARTCTQARGVLRRISASHGTLQSKYFGARGALANGATNGLERGGWRVGLRQQADAAPAARAVGDALEEAQGRAAAPRGRSSSTSRLSTRPGRCPPPRRRLRQRRRRSCAGRASALGRHGTGPREIQSDRSRRCTAPRAARSACTAWSWPSW